MNATSQALVKDNAIIFSLVVLALLLDVTGIMKSILPRAIYGLPSFSAAGYFLGISLICRFVIAHRAIHLAVAWSLIVILYFGWFILIAALTEASFYRPSLLVWLCIFASFRILRFRNESNIEIDYLTENVAKSAKEKISIFKCEQNFAKTIQRPLVRLNGWQRIGIIVSGIWALVVISNLIADYSQTFSDATSGSCPTFGDSSVVWYDSLTKSDLSIFQDSSILACDDAIERASNLRAAAISGDIAPQKRIEYFEVFVVVSAPLLLLWFGSYLLFWICKHLFFKIYQWIEAGFKR